MRVKDCMTKDVVCVKRSTTLSEILATFRRVSFHTLPVIEEKDKLIGVVTFEDLLKVFRPYAVEVTDMLKTIPFIGEVTEDEDILVADISQDLGLLVVADDIMSTDFVTIEPQVDVSQARQLMKLHSQNRLLVTEYGRLQGIISLFDIVLAIFKEKGIIANNGTH